MYQNHFESNGQFLSFFSACSTQHKKLKTYFNDFCNALPTTNNQFGSKVVEIELEEKTPTCKIEILDRVYSLSLYPHVKDSELVGVVGISELLDTKELNIGHIFILPTGIFTDDRNNELFDIENYDATLVKNVIKNFLASLLAYRR